MARVFSPRYVLLVHVTQNGGSGGLEPVAEGKPRGGMRTEDACQRPYEEVAERLGADLRRGLSWREANRRLLTLGPNEFEVRQEEPLWKKYFDQVGSPHCPLFFFKGDLLENVLRAGCSESPPARP